MSLGLMFAACHMLGDYVFQTNGMAANKLTDWRWRTFHVTVYTAVFIVPAALSGLGLSRAAMMLAAIWVTHFITDCRRWASGDKWPPKPILVDQSLHLAELAAIAWWFGIG